MRDGKQNELGMKIPGELGESSKSGGNAEEEIDNTRSHDASLPNSLWPPADPVEARSKRLSRSQTIASISGSNSKKPNITAIARPFASMPSSLQQFDSPRPTLLVRKTLRRPSMLLAEELEAPPVMSSASSGSSQVSGTSSCIWTLRRQLLFLLEEPFGSCASRLLSMIFVSVNLAALGLLCTEHVVSDNTILGGSWGTAMFIVNSIGTLEAALRLACSPRRRRFLGHAPNLIDGACVIPFWLLRVVRLGSLLDCPALFLLRRMELWLRLLKLCRYFSGWHLLYLAVTEAISALMLPLVALIFIMGIGACLVLIAEESAKLNGETDDLAIVGFPSALRFVLLCVIAIDAGPFYDLRLTSNAARISVGFLMMSGLVVFAMPMSIVGTCFCQVWFQRHRLLFIEAVRRRVERDSLEDTKSKLQQLFDSFTGEYDELGLAEFREFVRSISPNISVNSVLSIFASFDHDQDGSVSFQEVYAAIFPEDAGFEFLLEPREADEEGMTSERSQEEKDTQSYHSEETQGGASDVHRPLHFASLENRLRILERRQQQQQSPMTPLWCQFQSSFNSPGFRSLPHNSLRGSRRTSQSSEHSLPIHHALSNSGIPVHAVRTT